MDRAALLHELAPSTSVNVLTYETIDSTNATAKRLVASGDISTPTVLISDEQTAGYGRHGRAFFSPENVGVYLTLVWPVTDMSRIQPGKITTGMAVAAAEALTETLGVSVGIKWVNDLYYQHKKVAGILVEAVAEPYPATAGALVIGIGLNINPTDYPGEIAQKAGALTTATVNRERLAAAIINHFVSYFSEAEADVITAYRALSLVIGERVDVAVNQQTVSGTVVDIQTDGGLVVQTTSGQQVFHSGEITKLHMKDWDIS